MEKVVKSEVIEGLIEVAQAWQDFDHKKMDQIVHQVAEESAEFRLVPPEDKVATLDELGDVLVNAMRLIVELDANTLEAVRMIADRKATRRMTDAVSGQCNKDKVAERKEAEAVVKFMGL